ncbi:hypothetical protein K431DRAFT_289504 [Polychaeton citri CBS 116435]|uniref:Something about silencing protein 4 domain-containing protein n=1 Tax=Polychaeton citri CBS 116435 TaxID=1314669 RepID=A0A9P4Q1E4_9PEZI|nr:hypothetical protein K431DRAFT_289504 [Polychaeton citri CBS 116435]
MSPQATRLTRGGAAHNDAPMMKPQLTSVHTAHRIVAAESTRSLSTALHLPPLPPFMNKNDAISNRPLKRQKLDLRFRQSTLDTHFFARNALSPTSDVDVGSSGATPESNEAVPQQSLALLKDGPNGTLDGASAHDRDGSVQRTRSRRSTPRIRDANAASPSRAVESPASFDSKTQAGAGAGPKAKEKQRQRHSTPSTHSASGRTQEDKRSLRSHDDGPRFKSELATYFSNYEDVMFDLPKSHDFITNDAALFITDDADSKQLQGSSSKDLQGVTHITSPQTPNENTKGLGSKFAGSCALNGCQRLDLDFASRTLSGSQADPLSDAHFYKSHRRAERREKQMRNIEKERAMHEKVQLDALLNGLLGHDWLRVMGISGVTENEAKKFEPKRNFFVAEVEALVGKFHAWKKEEKRQRLQKDEARRATEEDGNERKEDDDEDDDTNEPEVETGANEADEIDSLEPSSSDLNASAAQQLRQEAAESLRPISQSVKARPKHTMVESMIERPLPPLEPMTSFYQKRHLRDAALRKARPGRNATAFGQPIPDLDEQEFELPADLISEDILRANARERRARNRRSIADAATPTVNK